MEMIIKGSTWIKLQMTNFRKYSYLLSLLVKRNIVMKYRGSALGVLWSLLEPLLNMIVLTIIFSTLFQRDLPNFPLYLISGRLMYTFFQVSTSTAMKSIITSAQLLKKVYIPKYMITLSKVISSFVIFLVSMIDLIFVMLITKAKFTGYLVFIPVYLILFLIFIAGFGLILATLATFFRDVEHLYDVFTMMLMYFSAIFYPVDIIPENYRSLLLLNPVYHYIQGFRQIVYYAEAPEIMNLASCFVLSIVTLSIGLVVFKRNQDKFMLYL